MRNRLFLLAGLLLFVPQITFAEYDLNEDEMVTPSISCKCTYSLQRSPWPLVSQYLDIDHEVRGIEPTKNENICVVACGTFGTRQIKKIVGLTCYNESNLLKQQCEQVANSIELSVHVANVMEKFEDLTFTMTRLTTAADIDENAVDPRLLVQ